MAEAKNAFGRSESVCADMVAPVAVIAEAGPEDEGEPEPPDKREGILIDYIKKEEAWNHGEDTIQPKSLHDDTLHDAV